MTAGPFDLDGDSDLGVVCVHGFTGTPYEMRYLGDRLAHAGLTVRGVQLPGHGTTVADLARTTWADWAGAVEDAVDTLRLRCGHIALVGQSLGGLLALHVAAHRHDIASVASLAAPLWLEGLARHAARWSVPLGLEYLPKLGGSDVRCRRTRAENPAYRAVPTRALAQLVELMGVVDDELPRIVAPVLVLHAAHDHTAPVACAARIAARTRAARIRILPRSYHLIAADVERDIVAAEVTSFIHQHGPAGSQSCAT